MTRIGFVIEQALGHITHTRNLQANVANDPSIEAHWGLIPFATAGLAAKVPVFNSNWTVRAGVRARRALHTLARHTRLDALFFHTQVPAVLAANWIRRYPSVVSLDATPLQYDELGASYAHKRGPGWLESLKWKLNCDCFRDARHIVTWSDWTRQGLVDAYQVPGDKVTVIPPGVNVAEWVTPAARQPRNGPVKILFVGADLDRKGGQVLLEAWRRLNARRARDGVPVELHLATRSVLPPEPGLFLYNDMQANSPRLKRLYHDCDIFCLPTFGDCLPMVLSEAGAAGLPAISTNVAAIGEITQHGKTGLIVPPGDVAALEHAMAQLVQDEQLRLQMGVAAVTFVAQQHDAQANTRRLLDLLKEVARSGAAA